MRTIRIGTRGSDLALWQARCVRDALAAAHEGLAIELEIISTRGDKVLDVALHKLPGKGLFTKEIEEALLAGKVDLAVHSLKDLPTETAAGLAIAAVLQREDPADAVISRDGRPLAALGPQASVMTGSLRREAQLRHLRPDVQVLPLRGNVPTRVRRFREAGADAVILARAGLVRLGMGDLITERLDPAKFLPACGQGAMAVEIRDNDETLKELCRPLDHFPTRLCTQAERAFLAAMGGGCQAPIGAYARMAEGDTAPTMTAMVASLDGGRFFCRSGVAAGATEAAANDLARRLAEQIGLEDIADIIEQVEHQPKLSRENP